MNTFGRKFKVSIFGESHGDAIGVVLDGVLPGIPVSADDFVEDILRRKSGAKGTTPRIEADEPEILSGIYNGFSTGAPLAIIFRNGNTRSGDYKLFHDVPRPGHADYTASVKWLDFNDPRGGGHFSGRLTLPIVAAGVIAKKMCSCDIRARLVEVGGVTRDEALAKAGCSGHLWMKCIIIRLSGTPSFGVMCWMRPYLRRTQSAESWSVSYHICRRDLASRSSTR